MAVSIKQEILKEEVSPCGAMSDDYDEVDREKFTAMQGLVLGDEKKVKDKDISSSFHNLMEYREAPASPSASSITTTLSQENPGSPTSPNSPPPAAQEMDDERLPNELLDEICEDIGMKEGMELDFVEFLMEQDMADPHMYMTQEAIMRSNMSSGLHTPTASNANSSLNTPTSKTNAVDTGWASANRTCGSPSYSVASSTNVTVATSSGSSSPVSKRFHPSNSGPSSPIRTNPPHVFKAPQTPPTPRRPIPTNQGVPSPCGSNLSGSSNISRSSSHSNHSNSLGNQNSNNVQQTSVPNRCYSPRTTREDAPSPQLPHSTTSTGQKLPPPYSAAEGQSSEQMVPSGGRMPNSNSGLQRTPSQQGFQRLGRPAPPNVNVQNMQQGNNKWMDNGSQVSQSQSRLPNSNSSSCAINSSVSMNSRMPTNMNFTNHMSQQQQQGYGRPLDSPLDQGYFTGTDSVSVRSYGSSAASTVPSSMSNTMQSSMTSHKQYPNMNHPTPTSMQKPVHFSDSAVPLERQPSFEGLYPEFNRTNVPDCELEEYRNMQKSMQLKSLRMRGKPEIAPYNVPNHGQQGMSPYGDFSRNGAQSSCMDNSQYDYSRKTGDSFNLDNNQNLMMQNYNEGMAPQSGMTSMNCQMQSCNGSMGMQEMDNFRGQNQYSNQSMDPSKGSMYDPMMQNDYCKPLGPNGEPQMPGDNCQYSGAQGSVNNSCGMMGMNQGMMGSQSGALGPRQGSMEQNYNPDYQAMNGMGGMANSQGYPQQSVPNMCANGPQSMHLNMAGQQTSNSGMMGYESQQFDQNRIMSGNMNNINNMNSQMYPQNQNSVMDNGMGVPTQGWNGNGMNSMPQTPQQSQNRPPPLNIPGQGTPMQPGAQCGQIPGSPNMQPCTIPNCSSCKTGSPHRPPMLASQQTFIQHLITDRSNAFRSHPLFPLLRDLIIADMNFNSPNFPYQLISNLPADFDKLLQNFLHRNPPTGNYQNNFAVESVIMDALKYAHHCLIEKIHSRQDSDKHSKSTSKSLSAIEEFCNKFDQSVRKSYIKPATLQLGNQNNPGNPSMGGPQMMGPMGPDMSTPTKDQKFMMGNMMMPGGMFTSPMAKKGLEFAGMMSPQFKCLKDMSDSASDCGSMVSSSSMGGKTESKKHPSLPKEAVAIMLDWLRQHKDNPYPNDDEKAMLIKQTQLTINQINYWFTNARRRILPKWAQQCK